LRRGPSLFSVNAKLSEGAQIAEVERLIEAEIKALATRGPTDAEVEKAHRRAEAGLLFGLQQNVARARRLGEFELYFGDARLLELAGCASEAPPRPITGVTIPVKDTVPGSRRPPREAPPPSGPARAYHFPKVSWAELPNGLKVATIPSQALPIVQLRVVILGG